MLSDRDDHQSQVANGALKGCILSDVMEQFRVPLMGKLAPPFRRFPLLLKFLDAGKMLSVQVHPSDAHPELIPAGDTGKTEAWVVVEAEKSSRIYAGLQPGTTDSDLRQALADNTLPDYLVSITPKPGDAVFIPAGTVHTLGGDVVVFEIQQNSDVTFRLYDWDHIDAKTGQSRPLQVEKALASIDFAKSTGGLVAPLLEARTPVLRERLFDCDHFLLWRLHGQSPFTVGAAGVPRVLVCIKGSGWLESDGAAYGVDKGQVWLLPAMAGACVFRPNSEVTLLEIALPESFENQSTTRGSARTKVPIETARSLRWLNGEKANCL